MVATIMNSLGLVFCWDETSGTVTVKDGYAVVGVNALSENTREGFRSFIGEYVRKELEGKSVTGKNLTQLRQ